MSKQQRFDEDWALNAAEIEMERSLSQLVPARPALGAADVLAAAVRRADAARRSARRQTWIWRGVAAGLAATLAVMVWIRRAPSPPAVVTAPIRGVESPAKPAHVVIAPGDSGSLPDCSYLILRQRVLAHGMDALPNVPAEPDRSVPLPGEGRLGDGSGA